MDLQEQVTNFELSKELKELGVKQDSIFHYGKVPYLTKVKIRYIDSVGVYIKDKICSAFTSSELIELLPLYLKSEFAENSPELSNLSIVKLKKCYSVSYLYTEIKGINLVNTLGKMLKHVIKNKLM